MYSLIPVRKIVAALRVVAAIGLVALATALYTWGLHVNPTTVALTYLIAILLLATWWGMVEATIASVVAVLAFNFFFLPPPGTLTIADPQNWVAFVAFLATAIIVSQLSGRARQREIDAVARQRDLERLYALSRALLLADDGVAISGAIARHIAETFDIESVAILDQRADTVSWAGSAEIPGVEAKLRDVARRATEWRDPTGLVVVAIQLGGAPIGSIAMLDPGLSDTVRQSISNLVAIGLERGRARDATTAAVAAQKSSELRATVLDALAHEFKTPLTSMKAATGDLLTSASITSRDRELVSIVDEDLDRFQVLVNDAVQMLRIDAGQFSLHRERHRLDDIVAATLAKFQQRLAGHQMVTRVASGETIDADRELVALALRQLLDNAVKYSPPTSTIEVEARSHADALELVVRNSGSLIPEHEQSRVWGRFYRGGQAHHVPGTGMGLAIVQQIVNAHGGTLNVSSALDSGTAFTLSFPRGGRPS